MAAYALCDRTSVSALEGDMLVLEFHKRNAQLNLCTLQMFYSYSSEKQLLFDPSWNELHAFVDL